MFISLMSIYFWIWCGAGELTNVLDSTETCVPHMGSHGGCPAVGRIFKMLIYLAFELRETDLSPCTPPTMPYQAALALCPWAHSHPCEIRPAISVCSGSVNVGKPSRLSADISVSAQPHAELILECLCMSCRFRS